MPGIFPNSYYTRHLALREHVVSGLNLGCSHNRGLYCSFLDGGVRDIEQRFRGFRFVDRVEKRIQR